MRRFYWVLLIGCVVSAGVFSIWRYQGRVTLVDSPPSLKADAAFSRATAALEQGQNDLARIWLTRVVEDQPDHVMGRLYLGQLLREAGESSEARKLWASISSGTPEQIATARFLEGMLAVSDGDLLTSEHLFLKSLVHNPRYLEPREQLVSVYRVLRQPEAMLEQLMSIQQLRPLSPLEMALSAIPTRAGFPPEETIILLDRTFFGALAENSQDTRLLEAYLEACYELGRFEEIITRTDDEQVQASEVVRSWRIQALIEQDTLEAASELRRTTDGPAKHWRLEFAEGCLAERLEEWDRGRTHFENASRIAPDERTVVYRYGTALQRVQHPDAVTILQQAVHLDELERLCLRLTVAVASNDAQIVSIVEKVIDTLDLLGRPEESLNWLRLAVRVAGNNGTYAARIAQLEQQVRQQTLPRQPEISDVAVGTLPPAALRSDVVRIVPRAPGHIEFREIAATLGLQFQHFNGNSGKEHLIESMGGGVLVVDYDRDGWDDLYFPQGSSLPGEPAVSGYHDQLWKNEMGQRAIDVTRACRLSAEGYGLGGTVGDFNEDGFEDVFVSNMGPNLLYLNNGDGTFTEAGDAAVSGAVAMSTSVVAADFNGDRLLDIYVANYVTGLKTCPQPDGTYRPCDPDSFDGAPDQLLLNQGDGAFLDVSRSAGIELLSGKGLGVVAADFDDDFDIDIYVANDGVPNFLLVNHGSSGELRFEEWGLQSGTAVDADGRSQAGMGVVAADFNHDDRIDLFVTNFYQEYNTLYINRGANFFLDRTRDSGLESVSLGNLGFGAQAADFDADGNLDLLVANGHILRDASGNQPWKMRPQVLQGSATGRFHDVSSAAGDFFSAATLGRGTALVDWDRDLRWDVVIVHQDVPAALLRNNCVPQGETMSIQLIGSDLCRSSHGARVAQVFPDGSRSNYWHSPNANYLSCNSREILIPLATQELVRFSVRWPSGRLTRHVVSVAAVATTKRWYFTEGGQSLPAAIQ